MSAIFPRSSPRKAFVPAEAGQLMHGEEKNWMRLLTVFVMGGVQGSDRHRRWRHGYLLRQVRH
jgi:hypothetical protein